MRNGMLMMVWQVTTFESELERLRGDIKLKDQALVNEKAKTKSSSDKLKLLSTQIHVRQR